MTYYSFNPKGPKLCAICNLPMVNPTRTQKVHQTGACKTEFDKQQYERDKEKGRIRYANAKRRLAAK